MEPLPPRLAGVPPDERDRLLSRAAHDLRGPLNAILGYAGTLLMRLPGPVTPAQEEQLRGIRTGARDLLHLIDRMVELAQIEAGTLRRARESVDRRRLLEGVAEAHREAALAQGVGLRIEAEGEATCDVRLVRRIVEELIDNAVRFTTHGVVYLSWPPAGGDRWTIRVEDTGPGIAPADRARLFRPFAPLGARATRDREGPGLGLYVAGRIAALLGGEIDVESEPGRGSVFTLSIPESR